MASRTASNSLVLALIAGLLALAGGGAAGAKAFGACLVESAPGFGNEALAASAASGLQKLAGSGVSVTVETPATPADYAPALSACARAHADLTIAVGTSLVAPLDAAAVASPGSRFAILGASSAMLPHRPPNAVGLVFRDGQAGYLAGYAAGLWARARKGKAVGSIGGIETPPLDRLLAGYAFGATRADPDVDTLNTFTDSVTDPAQCRAKAVSQISHGAAALFQAAGECGAGAAAAARANRVADVTLGDTDAAGTWLIVTVAERADLVVADAVRRARSGDLPGGRDLGFGARGGWLAYGAWGPRVPRSLKVAADAELRRLAEGRVPAIPTHRG